LSKTKYSDNLILKGGLVFYGVGIPLRRYTRDIDFLGTPQEVGKIITSIILEAVSVPVLGDGIIFDQDSLRVVRTQIDDDRNGLRVTMTALLGRSRIPLQIDIGLSDEVTLDTIDIDFPVLLPEMDHPRLKGYPAEFIISEKFQAIVRFAEINSRWKDYYDIWLLSQTYRFNLQRLEQSIKTTFEKRVTQIPRTRPVGLRREFTNKHDKDWQTFLTRNHLVRKGIQDFGKVSDCIWTFLEMPLQELSGNIRASRKTWITGEEWK
jgi:predicted nucleotidyltransferase component of viral defense system